MAININDGFDVGGGVPIDSRYVFATLAARDALVPVRRYEGLPVYVIEDGKQYILTGGIDNANWAKAGGGSGGGGLGVSHTETLANGGTLAVDPEWDSVIFIGANTTGYIIELPVGLTENKTLTFKFLAKVTGLNIDPGAGIVERFPYVALGGHALMYSYDVTSTTWLLLGEYKPGLNVRAIAADVTINDSDEFVLIDATGAARTVTLLPAADMRGKSVTVKKIDASVNAVFIQADGVELIDADNTQNIYDQWTSLTVVSDGTTWSIV
jgi:hypothetical protein